MFREIPGRGTLPASPVGTHHGRVNMGVTNRVARFRDQYWERGEPGRATPPALVASLYKLWLVGLPPVDRSDPPCG